MPASYPTSIKSFTTKSAGEAIQPGHVNDLQDEVTAVETDLLKSWTSWTPTWTGVTIADATVTAKYFKIGKLVFYELYMALGASTVVTGEISVDLPVNAAAVVSFICGHGEAIDANGLRYSAYARLTGGDGMAILADNGTSSVNINATVPFSWVPTDALALTGFYEAAA